MSILNVRRGVRPVEHRDRRIDPAAKFLPVDAVNKIRAITSSICLRSKLFEFRDELIRNNVVSIKREHPGRLDASLFEPKLPLVSMIVEGSLKDAHLWKRLRYRDSLVITEAIYYDDLSGPTHPHKRARNVRGFVIGEY